jgi:hypothetical protein
MCKGEGGSGPDMDFFRSILPDFKTFLAAGKRTLKI